MTNSSTLVTEENWKHLDDHVRRVDENRWLSSRFAALPERRGLIALYAFEYELARVRHVVSEQTLGQIRFQWWRESLEGVESWVAGGTEPRRHDVTQALADTVRAFELSLADLNAVVDAYEGEFLKTGDTVDPQSLVQGLACQVLGGTAQEPTARGSIPSDLRPAYVHLRVQRLTEAGRALSPTAKRLSMLYATLTGRI